MTTHSQRHGRLSFSRARDARLGLEQLEDRLALSTSPVPAPTALTVGSTYSSNDILVQFKANQPKAILPGTSVGQQLSLVSNLYEINLSAGVSVNQALAAYKANANVADAQPDYTLSVSSVPNDPGFSQQWSLQNTGQNGGTPGDDIGATQAWNVTTGSSHTIVAVLDTGIDYTHPDLYDNIWINQAAIPESRLKNLVDVYHDGYISMRDLNSPTNQGPGKIEHLDGKPYIDAYDLLQPMVLNAQGQDTGQGGWVNPKDPDSADGLVGDLIGWNFSANNDNPMDGNGHGTNVAGIIGAMGNNGTGVAGVDWNVQLMPIEFLDASGHGTVSQYIEGLDYAVAHGAKIVNNSWVGAAPSDALSEAIGNAQAKGVIFVAAAGNDGTNNDTSPVYPANYTQSFSNVISVAATDDNNDLAGFSNYGANSVTLAAPGVNIYSTLPGGNYGDMSGTSMATPEVSGVLALVWSEHPTWSSQQVIDQVLSTVTKVPDLQGKVKTGGIVDAAAAVGSFSASAVPPQVTSSKASGPTSNTLSEVRVAFSQAINPTTFKADDVRLLGPGSRSIAITAVTAVAGTGNRTFTLGFAKQTAAGSYTLYIGSDAKDPAGERVIPYQATFKITATTRPPTPPHVTSTSASGPTTNTLSTIRVNFNQAINPATLTKADLGLIGPHGHITISGIHAIAGTGNQSFDITFAKQTAAGSYTLYVGSDAKDSAGNRVTSYQATFKITATKPSTAPHVTSSSASGPTTNTLSTIRVNFNQAINPSTLTKADLGLIGPHGHITISGIHAVADTGNKSFTITFAKQTAAGSYTLYVGSDAKDSAGNRVTSYQATFKIAATKPSTAPHVTGVNATGPAANTLSTIRIAFDRAIKLSTLPADLGLLGPHGKITISGVKVVADTNNQTFEITFAKQTAKGAYTLYVGSAAKDLLGNKVTPYKVTFTIA